MLKFSSLIQCNLNVVIFDIYIFVYECDDVHMGMCVYMCKLKVCVCVCVCQCVCLLMFQLCYLRQVLMLSMNLVTCRKGKYVRLTVCLFVCLYLCLFVRLPF